MKNRRKQAAWVAMVAASTLSAVALAEPVVSTEVDTARQAAMKFGELLKQELMDAMIAGGPVMAVETCHVKAPAVAEQSATGWHGEVRRTSLRIRNSANQPDDWERSVLQEFEQRKAAGEPVRTLETAQIFTQGDTRTLRYMKAIPTVDVCLTCHGTQLEPAVQEKITMLYPEDQATGFAVGDLRGAFTLKKVLPPE